MLAAFSTEKKAFFGLFDAKKSDFHVSPLMPPDLNPRF